MYGLTSAGDPTKSMVVVAIRRREPASALLGSKRPVPVCSAAGNCRIGVTKRQRGCTGPPMSDLDTELTPAADLLHGVDEIAAFLGINRRRTYWLLEGGKIPAGKLGERNWCASRAALRAHLCRVTRSGIAA